jgi:hypothetical protein
VASAVPGQPDATTTEVTRAYLLRGDRSGGEAGDGCVPPRDGVVVVWVCVVRVVLPSTVLVVAVVVVVIVVPSADVSDLVLECCENDQLWTGRPVGTVGARAVMCGGIVARTGVAVVARTADVGERTSGGCCVARCA